MQTSKVKQSQRVALGVEYDGSAYHGWQRQLEVDSIQSQLEAALSRVADEPVAVHCAGRTDAGVHALGQLVHFDTTSERPLSAWVLGSNTLLPDDIKVRWAKPVDEDFHARFSATARRYAYLLDNSLIKSALFHRQITWHYRPLDEHAMHRAGQFLLGEHDFSSFRGAHCQSKTPMRHVQSLDVFRSGQFVVLDIKANAFLHHMVRNIMGVLLAIGEGKKEIAWAKSVLAAKARSAADITAPPNGLYLLEVDYPAKWAIEKQELTRFFSHFQAGK